MRPRLRSAITQGDSMTFSLSRQTIANVALAWEITMYAIFLAGATTFDYMPAFATMDLLVALALIV